MENHTQPISTNQGPLSVRTCQCGGVHLCLGGISLNLTRETVQYLHEQFGKILNLETQESSRDKDFKGVLIPFPN